MVGCARGLTSKNPLHGSTLDTQVHTSSLTDTTAGGADSYHPHRPLPSPHLPIHLSYVKRGNIELGIEYKNMEPLTGSVIF